MLSAARFCGQLQWTLTQEPAKLSRDAPCINAQLALNPRPNDFDS